MSPEVLLKFSQIGIALGLIISAIGGYGAFHYKNIIEKSDQNKQENRLSEIKDKLDNIITQNVNITDSQKQLILKTVSQEESANLDQLKNRYNLGYALLYVDKENWYYVPRNVKLNVDWFSTKVISLSEKQISIRLPDFTDLNHNIFKENSLIMSRVPGTSVTPFVINSIKLVAEYLSTKNNGAVIAVGFQEVK